MCRTCIPLIWPQINLMNGGSGSHQTVTCFLGWRVLHQVVNIFHLLVVLVLKNSEIVMCIPWGGAWTLPQGCTIISCLLLPCLCISLPSLISNCLNLSFGTWVNSWKLEFIPYKQETRNTEMLLCPEAPQGPTWFQFLCNRKPEADKVCSIINVQ